ncbi:MAG TPA: hypothetical protein VMB80_12100 [Candidatus Acidoferrum sp.]|nr:hypothetical protein [Candidatus Acidoferrum sp.]
MENPVAFDLNRAIQLWRENLASSPSFCGENLDELAAHLRDSVATLQAHGLSVDEAFLVASRRIGTVSSLESEFAKVNQKSLWLDRGLWILIAVQLWKIIGAVSALAMALAVAAAMGVNELLPSFGLQPISDAPIQWGVSLIASPLVIAILAGLGWRYLAWPREWFSGVFRPLLRRPSTLALVLFLTGITLSAGAGWLLVYWVYPILYHQNLAGGYFPWRNLAIQLPGCMILAALTFSVARRRLRLSPA